MFLRSGSRLGPYEIVSPIGAGGMGEVYRARDTKLNRDVAIKVLPELFTADPERLARFTREAQTLAALNHPNIAHIHGLEESGSISALVMELVEGEDLSAHIARGPIAPADALPLARQIADALEAAHEQGIVHRDLKPSNVKVRPDGTVKVLDFGLAKATDSAGALSGQGGTMTSPAMTAAGVILGTAAYMSPEQARGRAIDRRADIWAFGVVLWEMLTGRRLFPGDTVSDTIAAVLTKEPDLSAVPPQWRRLIARCLEKDVRKRLRDIGDAWLLFDDGQAAGSTSRTPAYRLVLPWAVAALLVGAASVWLMPSVGPATVPAPVAFIEHPPPGTQFDGAPVPSPDARHLAMIVRDQSARTRIWTRALGEASARALEGTEDATRVVWSTDSAQLAFQAQGQLKRIAHDGGRSSLIVTASPSSFVWLPGGEILLSIDGQGFARVPAAGGALRPVDGFNSEAFRNLQIPDLDISPDGRYLLFRQFGGETGVYVARLDGTGKRLLYPGAQTMAAFVGTDLIVHEDAQVLLAQRFNPADMSLVGDAFPVAQDVAGDNFSGSLAGALSYTAGAGVAEARRLTWFNRAGKMTGAAGPEGQYAEVEVSRRGRWLAFVRRDPADGNSDIWLQDLSGGAPSRFTSDPDVDHLLTISHDEREVAWEAHARGALNLMRRPADGSAPARLVRPWGRAGGTSDWSADGRFVLYHSIDGATGYNLWVVPMDGAAEPSRLTQPGSENTGDGQFSPDDRWLAYTSFATGAQEVYLQRLDGMTLVGGPVRVSEGGGLWPLWRGDGAELFFVSRSTLMATDVHVTSDRPAGTARALFTIAGLAQVARPYAVTPDGQRFVAIVSVADPTPRPATVILNWGAAQRR